MNRNKIMFMILFVFWGATISLQSDFLGIRYGKREVVPGCPWCYTQNQLDVVFLPLDSSILRLFAPADPDFLADLLWMRTAYYYGLHTLTDKDYPYLFNLLDTITDLSPRWEQPYAFGAVALPDASESIEDALYMTDKGLANLPNRWRLWFFKGYHLMKEGRNLEAADALQKAAVLPGAPVYLAQLSATLLTREGQRDMALRFLEQALSMTQDPRQRELIIQKIQKVKAQHDSTGASVE